MNVFQMFLNTSVLLSLYYQEGSKEMPSVAKLIREDAKVALALKRSIK
jgi:hypothetical protein